MNKNVMLIGPITRNTLKHVCQSVGESDNVNGTTVIFS